jgi:probable HAF family extracellular repeat protein
VRVAAAGVLLAALLGARVHGQCQYEVTVIQGPSCPIFGPRPTTGTGLNDLGHVVGVVGQCDLSGDDAFLWTPDGGFEILPRPHGMSSASATDINNSGAIVGGMDVDGYGVWGFLYEKGLWTPLPPMSGSWSYAIAVNEHGVVVGERSIREDASSGNAFIWSAAEGFTDLGLMGTAASVALDVNDAGDVVGRRGVVGFDEEAFLWSDEELSFLGPIPDGISSSASSISNRGVIAGGGRMRTQRGVFGRACVWAESGVTVVHPLGDGSLGAAGINEVGQVILGWVDPATSTFHALLLQHGALYDLNDLAPPDTETIERPWEINNKGQIVADGGDGHAITFLLTPIGRPLGDVDIDCAVGPHDLLFVLGEWASLRSPADLDGNGYVDFGDLLLVLSHWTE